MGPKIFTVREVVQSIPQLEAIFKDLDETKSRLKQCKSRIDVLEMIWGEEVLSDANPDRKEYQHYMEELEKAKTLFEETAKRVGEQDGLLKSVEQGLVDFYGVVDNRLVFLCWKRGEKVIEYWHHLEDGFGGRQPIPVGDTVL